MNNKDKLKIEVLISTMNQIDLSLLDKMNIKSNAIIANQAFSNKAIETTLAKNEIKMITTNLRGVGKNRNIGLFFSKADICILADDDEVFENDYLEQVSQAFLNNPEVDIFIFNVESENNLFRVNTKIKKVKIYNLLNYGAVRIAFRRETIIKSNITFSLVFGGGTYFGSGEDTLFLLDAYKSNLKIYAHPYKIARLNNGESSWFTGYNERYFYDKGKLLRCGFQFFTRIIIIIYWIKSLRYSSISAYKTLKLLWEGSKKRNMFTYDEYVYKKSK